MSRKSLEEQIIKPLLRNIKYKEKGLGAQLSEEARKQLEASTLKTENLLILDIRTLLYLLRILDSKLGEQTVSLIDLQTKLKNKGKKVTLGPNDEILKATIPKYLHKEGLYTFGNSFSDFKDKISEVLEEIYKEKTGGENAPVFFSTTEFDHAEKGAPFSAAFGISMLMGKASRHLRRGKKDEFSNAILDAALKALDDTSEVNRKNLIAAYGENYREYVEQVFTEIITNWNNYVNQRSGRLKAGIKVSVRPIKVKDNKKLAVAERAIIKIIRDSIFNTIQSTNLTTLKGSPSIEQKAGTFLIEKLKPKIRIKNGKIVIRVDSNYSKALADSHSTTVKKTQDKKPKLKQTKVTAPTYKPRIKVGSGKPVLPDIRSFIGILNARLSDTVAKNMGSPRLNYRTGRFANSARVVDIVRTSKGFPSINYTYMRYPYEVFEFPGSGSPLAQQGQRDPRDLIGLSIREIMAEYAIGRFYVRRV